ncbi:hypothetical protein RCL1_006795 [Eukaryota sp. TZLM3-RCL]
MCVSDLRKLLFLGLLVSLTIAGCICSDRDCKTGFKGSLGSCYCWCGYEAKTRKVASGNCHYVPASSHYSSGVCSLCSPSIRSIYSFEAAFLDVLSSSLNNADVPFPIRRCFGSTPYSGSYDACVMYGKGIARNFIGSYSVQWSPSDRYSPGVCSVCGFVDPCKYT